ncbi:MAG: MFS transporter [Phenylobacterium sp.]|uniref:MFS transporter n=1 Tax=Phenylobacterium sp. TaxID=1871053 RepID=UPI0027352DE4|nr:MFS transporter [Phenylobacterium sp.]MDP3748641.1 MFS transporter [Phenylobacterium sp.]
MALLLFLAYASLITIFQGIQNILLPPVVEALTPDDKVGTLAVLSTLASLTTIVALFAGGAISDRTRSRWGRRTPSLVLSWLASIALMPLMAFADSVVQLMIVMPLLWFTLNYYQSVLLAALPDRIPLKELGFASAAIGLGAPVGIFGGVNIGAFAPNPVLGYVFLAIPFTILTFALIALEREPSSLDEVLPPRPRLSLTSALDEFKSLRDRNFALAVASRFLMFLCYFGVNGYLFYVLQDYVGVPNLPHQNPGVAVSMLLTVMTISWLIVTPVVGFVADRLRRTAFIVAVVSFGAGLVTLLPALNADWSVMILFGVGIGVMFGTYFVLDLKLATLVLPSEQTAGRDLGLLLAAGSAPGVVAPAIAAGIIASGGYPSLFVFGALVSMAAGLCAILIRLRG